MMGFDNFVRFLFPQFWRQDEPVSTDPPIYHHEFGFEGRIQDRQLKQPTATEEEMDVVGLEPRFRNECAHLHIAFRACIVHNRPFILKCDGIQRELNHCYLKEKIDDLKEFERERRLNARERILAAKA